jgi:hypothetical protein
MRRVLLSCLAIAFALACGDDITEPVPTRTTAVSAGPLFATTTTEDGLSISTDKDDYQPGDVVHFTGSGWQPGDVLDIVLTDEPLTHDPHRWTVQVVADGTFEDDTYVVDEGDLDVKFTLVATSRQTGRSLTVQFTDGNLTGLAIAEPTTVTVIPGNAAEYTIKVAMGGNSTNCTVTLDVVDPASALPAGAVPSIIGTNPTTTNSTNANFDRTLRITTSAATTLGAYSFTVQATRGSNCQGMGNLTAAGTLVVQAPTTTSISASPVNSQTFGLSVTFTANVKRASDNSEVGTGTVRFYDGATSCSNLSSATQIGADQPVTSGQAQVSTSGLGVSPPDHTILACYLANTSFAASEASLSYTIKPAQAATALAVDPASGVFGGTTNLKATLMAGTNPVSGKTISFKLNGNDVCGISGSAACPTTDGSGVAELAGVSLTGINANTYPNGVSARFAGDDDYKEANGSASLTVSRADQTIDFPAVGPFTFGTQSTFQVAATASSGLPVSFATQTSPKCTVTGTTVTIIEAGTCKIRASQSGNSNYNPAPDVDQDITIDKASQTISFGSLTNKTYGDAPFTLSATGGASGNAVTFSSLTTDQCIVSGNSVTIKGAGSCTVRASQLGNVNYNNAPDVDQSFTIARALLTVSVLDASLSPYNKSIYFADALPPFNVSYSGFVYGENQSVLTGVSSIGFYQGTTKYDPPTAVGTYTITGNLSSLNYDITFNTGQLQIQAWTLTGFYQPVDMPVEGGGYSIVWNTVKGGSTVPLKFEVFVGTNERTDVAAILSFTATPNTCDAGGSDNIEVTTTGGTVLRYDAVVGQFNQNWQTPKTPGACYRTTVKTLDGSTKTAYFKLK